MLRGDLHLGPVAVLEAGQGLADGAQLQALVDFQHALDDGVHIALAGAQLGNDGVDLVLDGFGFLVTAFPHQRVHFQEQLGHGAVGAADAARRADGPAGYELLVGAVKDHAVFAADTHEGVDVLGGHGGILHADDPGILPHFGEQGGG